MKFVYGVTLSPTCLNVDSVNNDSAWIIFEHISKSVSSDNKESGFEIKAGLYFDSGSPPPPPPPPPS
jgi:hypothetical protein